MIGRKPLDIPLNLAELKTAIAEAEEKAGTEDMSVFIFEKTGGDPMHPRIIGVDALRFADSDEVNWSLYIFVR